MNPYTAKKSTPDIFLFILLLCLVKPLFAAECVQIGDEICIEGPATHLVAGIEVTRDC